MQNSNEKILLGGGCFWCIEAALQTISGVSSIRSGYAGGNTKEPSYREVCSGETGHAEVVEVIWNRSVTNLEAILDVFFTVHDPTSLNRQGNDIGTQYRSFIGYYTDPQLQTCQRIIKQQQTQFSSKIVTQLVDSPVFYVAESEHQNYYRQNANQPYCQIVIKPKLDKLN